MSELTIHTGNQGDHIAIHVDWFDENNVHYRETISIVVLDRDKPRTMDFYLNGARLAETNGRIRNE